MLVAPCFHTPLQVERVPRTARDWRLLAPLVFESVRLCGTPAGSGFLVLPGGSVINFASTPPPVWVVLPPTGFYDFATAMHDGAYRGQLVTLAGRRIRLVRALADELLLEAAEATGVSARDCALLYHGVRTFGAPHYRGVPDET